MFFWLLPRNLYLAKGTIFYLLGGAHILSNLYPTPTLRRPVVVSFLLFSRSVVSDSASPWTAACQASLSSISWSLLKHRSIESVMPSNHLILCCPLLLLPSIFPMSQLFASGGQSIRVSALASVLPVNIQGWFSLRLTGWISLQSKGLSRVFSSTTVQKHQFFGAQPSLRSNSHIRT